MVKFFAFVNRMKYIKRWSLMRSSREENLTEHTEQVCIIAHALAVINHKIFGGNADIEKAVLIAQYHDVAEVLTGDLPTPIKYYNPIISESYKGVEKLACEKLISTLPDFMQEEYGEYIMPDVNSYEYKLVKCADRISAYLKCVEEISVGNNEFKKAKKAIEKDILSKNCPEAEYYLNNFAPAYSLTLDELD